MSVASRGMPNCRQRFSANVTSTAVLETHNPVFQKFINRVRILLMIYLKIILTPLLWAFGNFTMYFKVKGLIRKF